MTKVVVSVVLQTNGFNQNWSYSEDRVGASGISAAEWAIGKSTNSPETLDFNNLDVRHAFMTLCSELCRVGLGHIVVAAGVPARGNVCWDGGIEGITTVMNDHSLMVDLNGAIPNAKQEIAVLCTHDELRVILDEMPAFRSLVVYTRNAMVVSGLWQMLPNGTILRKLNSIERLVAGRLVVLSDFALAFKRSVAMLTWLENITESPAGRLDFSADDFFRVMREVRGPLDRDLLLAEGSGYDFLYAEHSPAAKQLLIEAAVSRSRNNMLFSTDSRTPFSWGVWENWKDFGYWFEIDYTEEDYFSERPCPRDTREQIEIYWLHDNCGSLFRYIC